MFNSVIMWGAGIVCAISGAVAGHALGSAPIVDRSTLTTLYAAHDHAAPAGDKSDLSPDHYPLITRAGVIPVAALSEHGLYSQRRYRAFAYANDPGPAPAMAVIAVDRPAVAEPPVAPVGAAAEVSPPQPEVADGAGQPKLINVALALATP